MATATGHLGNLPRFVQPFTDFEEQPAPAPEYDPDLVRPVAFEPPAKGISQVARAEQRKQLKTEIRLLKLKQSSYDREINSLQKQYDAL
jgi:hypothetical protein